MKVLFIANHAGFSKFNAPYFKWFRDNGWEIHNASPGLEVGEVDRQYDVPIMRNPLHPKNIKAFFMIKKICKENHYDLVHCHTPVGGVLGRLCGRVYPDTKIIYTAHGFHFFKGAPIVFWLVYYPIEKLLAKKTDCIVTINDEDFFRAKNKFKVPVRKISGVGVNLQRFSPVTIEEKKSLREKYKFAENDFILIYCGQFIKRKNHKFILELLKELKELDIPNLKFLFVGNGKLEKSIKQIFEKNYFSDFVVFMGYRKDVEKLYQISDILFSCSLQEGFGINIVEGMASGLPVICSDIRGHDEILNGLNGLNGYRISLSNKKTWIEKINLLYRDKELYSEIRERNIKDARNFEVKHSVSQMAEIYNEVMGREK